ncbi:NAD-binding protein [Klebsiella pneumoniae subsp. pneumoniae]|nr:NAD-binding protein [Klebsiella pneumoniae subsp. pneumoniae]
MRGGLAGGTVLDAKAPMVMDRNFKPGFRIDLHIKDLAQCVGYLTHGVRRPAAVTAAVMENDAGAARGRSQHCADHSALACVLRNWRKWSHSLTRRAPCAPCYACLARHCQATKL